MLWSFFNTLKSEKLIDSRQNSALLTKRNIYIKTQIEFSYSLFMADDATLKKLLLLRHSGVTDVY